MRAHLCIRMDRSSVLCMGHEASLLSASRGEQDPRFHADVFWLQVRVDDATEAVQVVQSRESVRRDFPDLGSMERDRPQIS